MSLLIFKMLYHRDKEIFSSWGMFLSPYNIIHRSHVNERPLVRNISISIIPQKYRFHRTSMAWVDTSQAISHSTDIAMMMPKSLYRWLRYYFSCIFLFIGNIEVFEAQRQANLYYHHRHHPAIIVRHDALLRESKETVKASSRCCFNYTSFNYLKPYAFISI